MGNGNGNGNGRTPFFTVANRVIAVADPAIVALVQHCSVGLEGA
jgi:hypothetical protein